MTQKLLFLLLSLGTLTAISQNPATVISLSAKTIDLPCGTACTPIRATVPHIKQSGDFTVQAIPYRPFSYSGGTELVSLYADDLYSSTINLPFPVCFYGATYSSLAVGSNGMVTFDVTNAGKRNNFRQTTSFSNLTPVLIPYAGGNPNSLTSTYYPKASIMGVYHDIFPFNNGSRRIEWRIEGTAPQRRFLTSYRAVPMYSCTGLSATHQIVVYESTGVIEVYVQDKPVCTAWNEGLAILGIQNFERNKATFPAGKNTGRWGKMGLNEAYRFTPSAGTALFKKAELLSNGVVVAVADTLTDGDGNLQVNFPNICPAADSTQYILRVAYASCTNPAEQAIFSDTLYVKKEKLQVRLQTQDPTCLSGGSIHVQASGTTQPLSYRLNGGPAQASNVFTGLSEGSYTITVSGDGTCTETATATLTLQDDLLLVAQPLAVVCAGDSFTPQILSNASSFSWSPSTGISNPAEEHPQITAHQNIGYTLTVSKGTCRQQSTLEVRVKPLPVVNAGPDVSVLEGDQVQLRGAVSAGTFAWSPAAGLSTTTLLSPVVTPSNTITYRLTATNEGCAASDDMTLTVIPFCVKPMEAFTPNGDGINDRWLISTGNCLKKASVTVFNRYGSKVYQSDDYRNEWNGTYRGQPLADGTYYFVITYQLINGKQTIAKGNVTILR